MHLDSNVITIICYCLELPADTAGGEEEPVHEDSGTVVVGVVGQESVPLVLLLTGAVSAAPRRGLTARRRER